MSTLPDPLAEEDRFADLESPEKALDAWSSQLAAGGSRRLAPAEDGLINRTFIVGQVPRFVLQWVNPIFDPRIQQDIATVTEHLAAAGLVTPRLVPTDEGELARQDRRGFWRLMTFIPGRTLHRLGSPADAEAAGRLVGRFHAAVSGVELELLAPPRRIHETPRRMDDLRAALEACDGHPLEAPARQLGEQLLESWSSWQGELDLPRRLCHGDLKVSNLRFAESSDEPVGAVCLLDLDTLGHQELAAELGDAWRSWCNPAPEDEPEAARLDLELFAASARAWLGEAGELETRERRSLVPGIERIALELAARFCADAVHNRYFREDHRRFPRPGEHNLTRARSQAQLASSARRHRAHCERLIEDLP